MVDNSSGGSAEVELNLAPIIDCFTVLITYLLVTASFLTLTAIDVSVSANNPSLTTPPPPTDEKPLFATMDLNSAGEVILKITGGDLTQDYDVTLPGRPDGSWNPEQVDALLAKVVERWPSLKEISVSAAPAVKYKEIVELINQAQKSLPKIFISGG